jgi:sugar lactone lactonase YvrE
VSALARRLDATEGQLWTLALGLVLAVGLALAGIPPVVHHDNESSPAAAASAARTPSSPTASPLTPAQPVPETSPADGPGLSTYPVPTVATGSSEVALAPAPTRPFGSVEVLARFDARAGGVASGNGETYVGTDGAGASHVFVYGADGHRLRDITIDGQPDEHTRGITALTVARDGAVIAADAAGGRILRIDPSSGRQSTLATIIDLPSCVLAPGAPRCETSLQDRRPLVSGVTASRDGTILAADSAQGTVWRIRPGGEPEIWSQPVQFASGDGPTALAIAPDGTVICTVGTDLNPSNPTAASVYRIPVDAEGNAGDPVLLAKLASGDDPTSVAAGPDGRVFVALHGSSAIVVLNGDGTEAARVKEPALVGTIGLALSSSSELLATTRPEDGQSLLVEVSVSR